LHYNEVSYAIQTDVKEKIASSIVTAEGIVSLVELLNEEEKANYYPNYLVCDLLEIILRLGNYAALMIDAGAVPRLIKIINEKTGGNLTAVKILNYLSQDELGQSLIVNGEGLPALIRLLDRTVKHETGSFIDMYADPLTKILRNIINRPDYCLLVADSDTVSLLRQLQQLKISQDTKTITEEILNLCAQNIQKSSTFTFKKNFIEQANSLLTSGYKFSIQNVNESIKISCLEVPSNAKEDITNSLLAQAANSLTANLSDVDETKGKRNLTLYMASSLQASGLFNALRKLQPSNIHTTKETKDSFQCIIS